MSQMFEEVRSIVNTTLIHKLNKSPVESILASELNCEAEVFPLMFFCHFFNKFCHFKSAEIRLIQVSQNLYD